MPSICQSNWDCQSCPKAVDNTITHIFHHRGFHLPVRKCEENFFLFVLKGDVLVNSQEYAGTMLTAGEFILQAFGSKFELLVMNDAECIYYSFNQLELFCDFRFNYIMEKVPSPLIYSPLKITSELLCLLEGTKAYLCDPKVCRELLSLKRKELAFVLGYYYSDHDLATLVHPLSKYTSSFQFFILQNYKKVKTVEELAKLGGYTVSTLRRIFTNVFHEPVYEWMLARRKEGILDDLINSKISISEICYKYGFESLPHFSNFCKKSFGSSPRNLRHKQYAG
ncbi:transcriptional regulator, AraC family [Bacteroides faecichinchillae]|uniref:Transcriptional regulator, AraC family n=1 Tax=Bacteroides faecichinchillae TaxID=871325 RepID=A0A1M5C020_9BACE|nr:helix-turn-helix domain-containing protein [Bacteroides faecichinchillae]THG57891.1 helix-turn-helix domain-containing protein [Bacteroides faecichinchillae]SHF48088.1 transcriptional regulator, AraC family [Bacteroides faecichinchillae]